MALSLATPDLQACICVRGDVSIHPTAAIAPGVILRAEPNSRILVASGVCIGAGSILHAYEGILELGEGASLGAGVLVIGNGTIGAYACVGANATLFNYSVEPNQTIAANVLLGDPSRPIAASTAPVPEASSAHDAAAPATTHMAGVAVFEIATTTIPAPSSTPFTEQPAPAQTVSGKTVSGKAYLNTLLDTLLPHRQALQRSQSDTHHQTGDRQTNG